MTTKKQPTAPARKAKTDFALLSAAFATDQNMARQVCNLLATEKIRESEAKLLLRLTAEGQLRSTFWHSRPYYTNPYTWTVTTGNNVPANTTYTVTNTDKLPLASSTAGLTALSKEWAQTGSN